MTDKLSQIARDFLDRWHAETDVLVRLEMFNDLAQHGHVPTVEVHRYIANDLCIILTGTGLDEEKGDESKMDPRVWHDLTEVEVC